MTGPTTPPGSRLAASIREHAGRHGIALLPFVTAGLPRKDAWSTVLEKIAPHAAGIEVGIPFSDPMADGMTIQQSSRDALALGVTPRWVFDELRRVRARLATPVVLMSYLNPLMALGSELPGLCRDAGVDAIIIPDLPFEECEPWRAALASAGVGLVQMVTPMTPDARMAQLAAASDGFLYAVTRAGVTGRGDASAEPAALGPYLERCRAAAKTPVCAGFGVRSVSDVAQLRGRCDGAIVGSALVDTIAKDADPGSFLHSLRA